MRIKELVYKSQNLSIGGNLARSTLKSLTPPLLDAKKTNEAPLLQANILTCPTLDFFFNFRDIILKTNKGATYNLCLFMEADVAFARGRGLTWLRKGVRFYFTFKIGVF